MSKVSFDEVRSLFRLRDPYRWFWFREWLKDTTGPMLKDALRILALSVALYALGLTFGKGLATGISQSFQLNVRLQVSE